MLDAGFKRVSEVLDAVDEAERAALAARLGVQTRATLVDALSDPDAIRARAETLDAGASEALITALSVDPDFLTWFDEHRAALRPALDVGLIFAMPEGLAGPSAVIPLEIRVALHGALYVGDAPLAVLLANREFDDLESLAQLHAVELRDDDDAIDAAVSLARSIHDIERLHELFESLQPTSRALLEWLCEIDGPVPESMFRDRAEKLDPENAAASIRVLHRLGLVLGVDADGDSLETVPPDTREALRPILETAMSEACREWYQHLRDDALPGFRDQFPAGYGGSLRLSAVQRVLRALRPSGAVPPDGFDRLLTVLRILDPEAGIGELASVHLDVFTDDGVARQALRSWLGSLDDDFTRVLLEPFGGDPLVVADWILRQPSADEPIEALEPVLAAASDRDAWTTLLFQLRAHLIFALSLLPAGQWFRLDHAARWYASVYRRIVWQYGAMGSFGDEFPRHALPMPGVDLNEQTISGAREMLLRLFAEFLMPLGAIRLDDSGTMFMANSEALRVFRDGDDGFDLLWSEAEDYVGDDIDLWLPLPTDPGLRPTGVGFFGWIDEATLVVSPRTHLFDLTWLSNWGTPMVDGAGTMFSFDAESIARGLEAEAAGAEEFLLWLRARAGAPIPGRVRSLFPFSATPADDDTWWQPARRCVDRLIEQLESWHESPPVSLMEEIRSWGEIAGHAVAARLEHGFRASTDAPPLDRHLALLLGEVAEPEATDLLASILQRTPDERLEGAVAMAMARVGLPALESLVSLLETVGADPDKRMVSAGALSSMAVLHPPLCRRIADVLEGALPTLEEPDLATLIGINLAETGHPASDTVLYQLRDQGFWLEEMMPFDEALWIASLSPAVWGHPFFAAPLAHLYPTSSETARIRAEADVDALFAETGVSEEQLLGRAARPPRRRKDEE